MCLDILYLFLYFFSFSLSLIDLIYMGKNEYITNVSQKFKYKNLAE